MFEATIDLGEIQSIRYIAGHFLNDDYSRIYFPSKVEFEISNDGKNFHKIGETEAPEKNEIEIKMGISILPTNARFVKIKAINKTQKENSNSSQNTWIFIDEIIIE